MAIQRAFDCLISSNFPLLETGLLEAGAPDYDFRLLPPERNDTRPVDWFHHWMMGERVWASLAKCSSEYLIRYHALADFWITADRRQIRCHPQPGIPAETISHLFLDQVFPCLLGRSDRQVLHAGAVAFPAGAVAFVGVSGRGKSTLAVGLSQQGFPLLTDDGLLLQERAGEFRCVPSHPMIRLWPESIESLFGAGVRSEPMAHYSGKRRLNGGQMQLAFAAQPTPLRRIYLLAEPEQVEAQNVQLLPLASREAYLELVNHVYRLDVKDWARIKEMLDFMARLAAAVRIYRLSFPRDYAFLPLVGEAILNDLG